MNEELRRLFPITKRLVYLNHAAVSPPPVPTVEAVEAQVRDVATNGSLNYRSWIAVKERARAQAAEMIGARPSQIAFMRNTSDGLATVANGLTWQAGDNIVTFRGEFPSNIYPWLRVGRAYGVEVRMCQERDGRIDLDEFVELIDRRTRVVAISLVQYGSGFRTDIERIARHARRRSDALTVVDVIQAMGVVPIDVAAELIDVAAGACHKWLLTPEGVGLLYLSDRARERVEPTLVGWVSVPAPEEYSNFEQEWNADALPWETGTAAMALIHGLDASLKLLIDTGVGRINKYLDELTDHLCEGLSGKRGYKIISSRHAGEKSQIVSVRHDEWTAKALFGRLRNQNITAASRGDRLRIAPHLYNTPGEIDALLNALP